MMGSREAQRRRSMRHLGGQGSVKEGSVAEGSMGAKPDPDPSAEPSCHELYPLDTYVEAPLTMYQWMRAINCKTYEMKNLAETYPSIRPPISRCDDLQTLQNIDDAMDSNQCGRMFDSTRDDVMAVWHFSPNKESLAWYGIGPQAEEYNKALCKSLKAASLLPKKPKKSCLRSKLKQKKKAKEPSGAYVLNRECLKDKLDKMPNVLRQLRPTNTLSFMHCPPRADRSRPFEDRSGFPEISIAQALDMEKPAKPPKQGLRRNHWYCPSTCGGPENKCTDYEWAKYKMDPRPYDEAFQRELAEQEAAKEPEPGNYEELYKSLVTCFVQDPNANDMCAAFEKCCKDPAEPPTQGCNEFVPDGAGGDGKFGGGGSGDDSDDERKGKGKNKGHGDGDDDLDGLDQDELDDEDVGDGDGKGGQGDGTGRGNKGRGHGQGKKGDGHGGKNKKFEEPLMRHQPEEEVELEPPTRLTPPPPARLPPEPADDENADGDGDGDSKDGEGKKKGGRRRKKKGNADKNKDKNKGKNKGKDGGDGKDGSKSGKGGDKDCPCEICCQVGKEEDSPLIKEMRKRDRERQVRDYLRQMRHRQYLECKEQDYRAPQHRCEDVECDTRFCGNPRMQTHFGRVQAVQQLQWALQRRNRCGDNCLSRELDGLLARLCNRLTRSGYCG